MRSKDVVIGMYVRAFQKTAEPMPNLEHWRKFIDECYYVNIPENPVLKIVGWNRARKCWLVSFSASPMRLYYATFHARDFEPYIEEGVENEHQESN